MNIVIKLDHHQFFLPVYSIFFFRFLNNRVRTSVTPLWWYFEVISRMELSIHFRHIHSLAGNLCALVLLLFLHWTIYEELIVKVSKLQWQNNGLLAISTLNPSYGDNIRFLAYISLPNAIQCMWTVVLFFIRCKIIISESQIELWIDITYVVTA